MVPVAVSSTHLLVFSSFPNVLLTSPNYLTSDIVVSSVEIRLGYFYVPHVSHSLLEHMENRCNKCFNSLDPDSDVCVHFSGL